MGDSPRPGYEKIPLDLSRIPTVEQGLADAAERRRRFIELTKAACNAETEYLIFREHLPFVSFINRATSLHDGIVSAVQQANPHAAFTLLRAYLELVVLVYYIDKNPNYLSALERPMSELPKNTRKRFSDLFAFAASEMAGVALVYEILNEMAHFGSTALWSPFTVDEEREGTIRFSTAPHWHKPEDARTALAMLRESDEAFAETIRRYAAHHLTPRIKFHIAWASVGRELVAAGMGTWSDETGASMSPELAAQAEAAGLLAWCAEHAAMELAEGVSPQQLLDWLRARPIT